MKVLDRLLLALSGFVLVFGQSSCTTATKVPYSEPAELRQTIKVGDQVEIKHVSGRALRFTVDEVTEHTVSGNGNTLLWESITAIRIREFSAGKTAAATAGGVTALVRVTHAKVQTDASNSG